MARGFNKAIIIGNLAKDPEIRYTASGTAVVKIVVAVNRQWKSQNGEKQEEVDFLPVVVWDKMAENVDRYLSKGSSVLVEGRISVRSYEGRDGQKRYATEIMAQTVQFLGGGKSGESAREDNPPDNPRTGPDSNASRNGYVENGRRKSNAESNAGGNEPYPDGDDDEDIPF